MTELPFEKFVDSWLAKQPSNRASREVKRYVQKAITMIKFKLGDPCCTDPNADVTFATRFDNDLTNTLRGLMQFDTLKGIKQSLERTKDKLQKFVDGCC